MKFNKEQLEKEFFCPKCHARGALVQEVSIGRTMANLFPLPANSYLTATCSLCGYTEFYNLTVAVKAAKAAKAQHGKVQLAEKPE